MTVADKKPVNPIAIRAQANTPWPKGLKQSYIKWIPNDEVMWFTSGEKLWNGDCLREVNGQVFRESLMSPYVGWVALHNSKCGDKVQCHKLNPVTQKTE